MSLMSIAEWLETTGVAALVRDTLWGFPIVVAIHIFSMTFSVGVLLWFDLRLLGVSLGGYRVSSLYRRFAPLIFTGFIAMFVSGGMLLAAYATAAYGNLYFRIKVAAMLLAGVNAVVYHLTAERRLASWDDAGRPPLGARIAGLTSITLWAVVIVAGRMMSYTMF
jgi:hypothetical protein